VTCAVTLERFHGIVNSDIQGQRGRYGISDVK
jgi:hypothetical protein